MERDLRDPQAIGDEILRLREQYPGEPAHGLADYIDENNVQLRSPAYQTTIGAQQALRYQQELKQRAADGDKFAISLLNGNAAPGADDPV
jgi:N-acetylglucosamine kinase-like BadF-type ATPase